MDFITRKTKSKIIISSSLILIALITLIMLSTLLNITNSTRILMSLIYISSLLVLTLLTYGFIELLIFKEYKYQNKFLCSKSIINICSSIILFIMGLLFLILRDKTIIDLRYFIFGFLFLLSVWSIIDAYIAIKHKLFDSIISVLTCLAFVSLTVLVILTIYINSEIIKWITIIAEGLLILLALSKVLISYTIKEPIYLETEKAIQIRNDELDELALKKQKDKNILEGKNAEDILNKLKDLYESNLINLEEYNKKKIQVLNRLTKGSR